MKSANHLCPTKIFIYVHKIGNQQLTKIKIYITWSFTWLRPTSLFDLLAHGLFRIWTDPVKLYTIVCTPPPPPSPSFLPGWGGLNLLPNFQKERVLGRTLTFRGRVVGRRGWTFWGDVAIFNSKKVDNQKCFSPSQLRIQTGKS